MQAEHLERVWNSYADRFLSFVHGRVSDETEAEDILQEVFLRVHEGLLGRIIDYHSRCCRCNPGGDSLSA